MPLQLVRSQGKSGLWQWTKWEGLSVKSVSVFVVIACLTVVEGSCLLQQQACSCKWLSAFLFFSPLFCCFLLFFFLKIRRRDGWGLWKCRLSRQDPRFLNLWPKTSSHLIWKMSFLQARLFHVVRVDCHLWKMKNESRQVQGQDCYLLI